MDVIDPQSGGRQGRGDCRGMPMWSGWEYRCAEWAEKCADGRCDVRTRMWGCGDVRMWGCGDVGMCELRLIIWTDEFDSSFLRERFSKYNGLNGLRGARIVTRGWTVD